MNETQLLVGNSQHTSNPYVMTESNLRNRGPELPAHISHLSMNPTCDGPWRFQVCNYVMHEDERTYFYTWVNGSDWCGGRDPAFPWN